MFETFWPLVTVCWRFCPTILCGIAKLLGTLIFHVPVAVTPRSKLPLASVVADTHEEFCEALIVTPETPVPFFVTVPIKCATMTGGAKLTVAEPETVTVCWLKLSGLLTLTVHVPLMTGRQ